MSVLETAILVDNETLIERSFCKDEDLLHGRTQSNILTAIENMASSLFNEDIESFTIGENQLLIVSRHIQNCFDPNIMSEIKICALAEKNSNIKAILKCMNEAIDEFLDRFHIVHICSKKKKLFQNYSEKLDSIFGKINS
jgi:hypothetical protein